MILIVCQKIILIKSVYRMSTNIFKKLVNSIKSRGILVSIKVLTSLFFDLWFDIRFGTDTMGFKNLGNLDINSNFKKDGEDYIPTRAKHLRRIFKMKHFSKEDTFVDLGSGKGRTLLIASDYLDNLKGVEFSEELCDIARKNIIVYGNKTGKNLQDKVSVFCTDVTKYIISDEDNIFYLYNPFNETVLSKFISNLEISISKAPRKVWIIYYYPVHSSVFDDMSIFIKQSSLTMDGVKCIIYKTHNTY